MPPSSSVIGLTPVRATFVMIAVPAAVEPVKLTLPMPGWPVSAVPVVGPSPSTTLTSPAGSPASTDKSGQQQGRERRHLGGLEHHGIAGGQRRAELPAGHRQREVPRRDRPDDAVGLAHHEAEAAPPRWGRGRRSPCRRTRRRSGSARRSPRRRRRRAGPRAASRRRPPPAPGPAPSPRSGRPSGGAPGRARAGAPLAPAALAQGTRGRGQHLLVDEPGSATGQSAKAAPSEGRCSGMPPRAGTSRPAMKCPQGRARRSGSKLLVSGFVASGLGGMARSRTVRTPRRRSCGRSRSSAHRPVKPGFITKLSPARKVRVSPQSSAISTTPAGCAELEGLALDRARLARRRLPDPGAHRAAARFVLGPGPERGIARDEAGGIGPGLLRRGGRGGVEADQERHGGRVPWGRGPCGTRISSRGRGRRGRSGHGPRRGAGGSRRA